MAIYSFVVNRYKELIQKHRSGVRYLTNVMGFLAYLMVGACLFQALEGGQFEEGQRSVLEAKDKIRKKYPDVSDEVLDDFIDELRIVGIRGLPKRNSTIVPWKFADAWFFVVTLLTTVGYGHFTPRTLIGKVVCIAYTAIGIPLTLLHLAYYVDQFCRLSEAYKSAVFRQYKGKIRPLFIRFLHVATLMSFIVMICFILPGSFFAAMEENWGMFDGIYFCFISLTTVGLGDLVPAMNPDMPYVDLYKFGASFYILIGIAIIMFMMSMCGDYFRNFNSDYQELPYTISTEKSYTISTEKSYTIPTEKFNVNPDTVRNYGSIITNSGKSDTDEKILLPT